MEISRVLLGVLFLVVGIMLSRWIVKVKLELEGEIKGGQSTRLSNILPIGGAERFSEKGNLLRKRYNNLYYMLIVYSLALFVFMRSGE
jgi:hypothetical protein